MSDSEDTGVVASEVSEVSEPSEVEEPSASPPSSATPSTATVETGQAVEEIALPPHVATYRPPKPVTQGNEEPEKIKLELEAEEAAQMLLAAEENLTGAVRERDHLLEELHAVTGTGMTERKTALKKDIKASGKEVRTYEREVEKFEKMLAEKNEARAAMFWIYSP